MATTLGRTQRRSLIQHDIFLIRGDTARSRATRVSATTTGGERRQLQAQPPPASPAPHSTGGPTALHNLVLVCSYHHRLLHFSEWEVAIVNGTPEFYPPPFLDPERKPLRNHLHHRLE